MKYCTILELTYKDYEFGIYTERELHVSLESAARRVERAKKESDSYKTLTRYAYDETLVREEPEAKSDEYGCEHLVLIDGKCTECKGKVK